MKQSLVNRLWFDILLFAILLTLYLTKFYEALPPPVQLVSIKVLLVSAGFLHATVTRKLAFPKVDWQNEKFTPKNVLVIVLYIIIIYAYSQGG